MPTVHSTVILTTLAILTLSCGRDLPRPPISNDTNTKRNSTTKTVTVAETTANYSPNEVLRSEPLEWEHSPLMRGLFRIQSKLKTTAYVHGIDVDVRRGYFAFDCSGMVDWVLRGSTPVAAQSVRRGLTNRPLARDFVNRIASLAPNEISGGWKRITKVVEAQPGDVIAWVKPKFIKSENTGHVAIIVQRAIVRNPNDTAYLLRIADSSRLIHEDDSRQGRGGFGFGTILVETNANTGAPSGFHFSGSRANHAFGTQVVIGRPLK